MSVFKNTNRIIFTLCIALLFTACGSSDFTVNSTFSNTNDIQEGTPVYFDNQAVGEVIDVGISDAGVTTRLKLDRQAATKIGSKAVIVVNRLKQEASLEIYNRTPAHGDLLQDGQSIKGFDSMFQFTAWMVGESIKLGSSTVSEYMESFQGYFQSDKFDQDKQAVREQFDTAKGVAQDAMRQVEEDLNQAADELVNSQRRAAEVVEDLGEELAPVVKELASNGAELIAQLEEFVEGLQQSDSDRQQAGQEFLDSLIRAMEKLNQAMEASAEKSSKSEN